jgi:hypothetical protein
MKFKSKALVKDAPDVARTNSLMLGGIAECEFEYVRNITLDHNFNICMNTGFFVTEANQLWSMNRSVCARVADHISASTEAYGHLQLVSPIDGTGPLNTKFSADLRWHVLTRKRFFHGPES